MVDIGLPLRLRPQIRGRRLMRACRLAARAVAAKLKQRRQNV